MNDLISRQAAIDAVHEDLDGCRNWNASGTETANEVEMVLDCLPSAQTWIPITERLPESKPEDLEYPTVLICSTDGTVELGCYYESTKEWAAGEYFDDLRYPVAWMPLPDPYK